MNDELVLKCKLFVQNRDILKSEFKWASSNLIPMCAYMYAGKGLRVDAVRINGCKQIIKKHIGVFSKVKGDAFYPLATELALQSMPEKSFDRRVQIYHMLKKEFGAAIYIPWIAFSLAEAEKEEGIDVSKVIREAAELEQCVVKEFGGQGLDGMEGVSSLTMLCGKSKDDVFRDLKIAYEILSDSKINTESLPILCYMLAAGNGEIEDSCERLLSSYDLLIKNRCKFEREEEVAALGILANSKLKEEEYITAVTEISEYLSVQKGFGIIHLSSHDRHMYAALLAADGYCNKAEKQIALFVAMKKAMYVAVLD